MDDNLRLPNAATELSTSNELLTSIPTVKTQPHIHLVEKSTRHYLRPSYTNEEQHHLSITWKKKNRYLSKIINQLPYIKQNIESIEG